MLQTCCVINCHNRSRHFHTGRPAYEMDERAHLGHTEVEAADNKRLHITLYEEELSPTGEENERLRQQLEAVCKTQVVLNIEDIQQLIGHQEACPPQPQGGSSTLVWAVLHPIKEEEEDLQPPYVEEEEWKPQVPCVKEEEEELSITQEGEHFLGPEEANLARLPLTGISVKTDDHEDKPPESSQLHHRPNEEMREAEPSCSSSLQHMTTEADGDHCGGSQADNLLAPLSDSDDITSHSPEDEDSDYNQESLSNDTDCEDDMMTHTGNKHLKKRTAASQRVSTPTEPACFWRTDVEQLHKDVEHGELLSNHDATFQMPTDAEDKYRCVFELFGVEDIVTKSERRSILTNARDEDIFGGAVAATVAVVMEADKEKLQAVVNIQDLRANCTGRLHHTRTGNMQGKEDILGKKPPKAFILLVAAILLTLMIGLFIFIFMPSQPPNLQNLPEPLTALDSAEPVTIGMLIDRIKKFAADVEARLLNAGICPLTWRKHANRCFLFVSDKKNWNDAEANCVAMSGHLASVHNQTMYDFLKGLANEQDIWVGGYKAGNEMDSMI
ncbi:uncharacterized protein LOC129188210 isoform X2 [Dunckerocampus dactyliophorus]|uniref:uncharacterized protein LOC129188210 isoform X2 n=1 Tax=Dunckerocampus dactyliophorus TaxID=161453 RepID=UPI002405246C|nr:uncharacterized protein LOC129188210 isoform X2 [Dunckerocampus dactyliophorus]